MASRHLAHIPTHFCEIYSEDILHTRISKVNKEALGEDIWLNFSYLSDLISVSAKSCMHHVYFNLRDFGIHFKSTGENEQSKAISQNNLLK